MAAADGFYPNVVTGFASSDKAPVGSSAECECPTAVGVTTFATAIPAMASQVLSSGETVQVTGGSSQALASTRYYYFVSNISAVQNGQSLLYAIKSLLETSLGSVTWTVVLTKVGLVYKIQISHDSGSSKTITFGSTAWANALGFDGTGFTISSGATLTADWPSIYWWTPDQLVSLTGPVLFDPTVGYGVPSSSGASQRSPDMTTAYVQNGVQWSATYLFNAVQYYYRVRKHPDHPNEDLETWWQNGPAVGRKFLWWRSRDLATGSSTPSAGSASPYRYIVYAPQEALRGTFPAKQTSQYNKIYWDVTFDVWVTEAGEAVLT